MSNATVTQVPRPGWEESLETLNRMPGMSVQERRGAVRSLVRDANPGIRRRAIAVGSVVLSDEEVESWLREDADDVVRNAGLEILKAQGKRALPVALRLLRDADSHVVLQAVLALDHIRDPRAVEPLRRLLAHQDPNVVQATITALGHLADARVVDDLLPFLAGDPWLQMAAVQALGDLRSSAALGPLKALLPDLLLGPLAAEALARIGGARAFRELSRHWMTYREELDSETVVGLLAHMAQGLPLRATYPPELRTFLCACLEDGAQATRVAAATCLLALGPGVGDGRAVNVLAAAEGADLDTAPVCVTRRKDLIPTLLGCRGRARAWGLYLAAQWPDEAPEGALVQALADGVEPTAIAPLVSLLETRHQPALAAPLLDLFLRLSPPVRARLAPVVARYAGELTELVASRPGVDTETGVVLAGLLGEPAAAVIARVLTLGEEGRLRVVPQLGCRPDVVDSLPWHEWLLASPSASCPLAAEMIASGCLRQRLPELREALTELPHPALIRAAGELGDQAMVPTLVAHLDDTPLVRALVLDSLGRLGGPEARRALRDRTADTDPVAARLAYRALAACATAEEGALFRDAAAHPDWGVRLAVAEVLGRFPSEDCMPTLLVLAADPVSAVAQKALAGLEG